MLCGNRVIVALGDYGCRSESMVSPHERINGLMGAAVADSADGHGFAKIVYKRRLADSRTVVQYSIMGHILS
ncbi:hypothetical protein E1B28_001998 [Marasmius oreades]|uniref:Uncharacterized protein n=1 Tax=Marasmius oreades TaxID=181124 RepID=A0A9P7V4M5_9AGAR|nr:uncharacterized protein E1B28_001998 [Marasmius oreades]KAG7100223.1 hypothetical protein E1B28_001998 [Marasmius oreades]